MIAGQREILDYIQERNICCIDDILMHFDAERKKINKRIAGLEKFQLVEKYKEKEKVWVKVL